MRGRLHGGDASRVRGRLSARHVRGARPATLCGCGGWMAHLSKLRRNPGPCLRPLSESPTPSLPRSVECRAITGHRNTSRYCAGKAIDINCQAPGHAADPLSRTDPIGQQLLDGCQLPADVHAGRRRRCRGPLPAVERVGGLGGLGTLQRFRTGALAGEWRRCIGRQNPHDTPRPTLEKTTALTLGWCRPECAVQPSGRPS